MSNLLESAKAIVYTLLSHHKGEVTDEILISYTEYDIEVEDNLINEINIFHKITEDPKVFEMI